VEAWKLYRAKKDEALAIRNAAEMAVKQGDVVRNEIRKGVEEGFITDQEADAMRKKLESALKPQIRLKTDPLSFAPTRVQEERTVDGLKALETESEILKTIRAKRGERVRENAVTAQHARQQEFIREQEEARLEIFRAQKELELARLRQQFDAPESKVSIEEFTRQQEKIITEIFEREQKFIEDKRAAAEAQIFKTALRTDPSLKALEDESARRQKIEADNHKELGTLRVGAQAELERLESEHQQRLLTIAQTRQEGILGEERAAAQNRLVLAQLGNDALVQKEAELQQRILEIRDRQKNLPSDKRLTDEQIRRLAVIEQTRLEVQAQEAAAQRLLVIERARIEAATAVANANPSNDLAENQEKLNNLLREQNNLIGQEISLNQQALASGVLAADEVTERQRQVMELQARMAVNVAEINRQTPTNLPNFQGALGFRNRLTETGGLTGERELIAPWLALDAFLSGTLQTTFDGITASVSGLITGTRSWVQVWTQVGAQLIDGIVQLILEYTLFHQIRMALDRIFFSTQQAGIIQTSAAAKAAQLSQAATAKVAGATTAAAYAPAAAAASVSSFGSAAVVGMALTLAAIAAIVAAVSGAFAEGGIVRGPGGPKEDRIRMAVRPGTGVLNASAVKHYGGERFIKALEKARRQSGILSSFSGGNKVGIRVSNGEGILSPETVRFLGPDVIEAINKKRFRLGEVAFARGGIAGFEGLAVQSHMAGYAGGGIVAVPPAVANIENSIISDPLVNVEQPPIHFVVLDDPKKLDAYLESAQAGRKIVQHVRGARFDLGIG
jgi:hypothetical protein